MGVGVWVLGRFYRSADGRIWRLWGIHFAQFALYQLPPPPPPPPPYRYSSNNHTVIAEARLFRLVVTIPIRTHHHAGESARRASRSRDVRVSDRYPSLVPCLVSRARRQPSSSDHHCFSLSRHFLFGHYIRRCARCSAMQST